LFEAYYQLFGIQPFFYHMTSFLWRVLGGFASFWLFRQLWPQQRLATFMMALLFTLYPGYTRWMEGFENQPRILSSFLEALSVALTLYAIQASRTAYKILAWIGSILTGWLYIALVDFAFGMEALRLLCVFLLVHRDQKELFWIRKSILTVRTWGIAAIIPAGFLFWRLFLFQNERPVTDIGLQLSYLTASPLLIGMWWLVRLLQSAVNVAVTAWGAPLFQDLFEFSLAEIVIGFTTAGVSVLLLVWACITIWKTETGNGNNSKAGSDNGWQSEAIWIGIVGVFAGVLPIIAANRYVTFGGYSHYALPASLASVMGVAGILFLINSRLARWGVASVLVLLAVLTHYTASLRVLHEEQVIAGFWHQVVWRAPGIKAGTTLVVHYPTVGFAEDVDAVAGPANFLYFPEQTNQIPAVYPLIGLPDMQYITHDVLGGVNRSYGYRTHVGEIDYSNLLVMSQPVRNGCVHVMDAQWPRYSDHDPDQILLLGQYSVVDNVLTYGKAPRPAEYFFGPEPARTWCYYYQQAELALQAGNWEKIAEFGEEVTQQNLTPNDRIEWAPFLQAYAFLGDEKAFKATAIKIDSSSFMRKEACHTLLKMQEMGIEFTTEIQSLMDERLCRGRVK
jgi:hypothetical protein